MNEMNRESMREAGEWVIQDKNEEIASEREKDACSAEVRAYRSESAGAGKGAEVCPPPFSFFLWGGGVASPLEVWEKDVVMKDQS